jgi:hypothetical protein
MGNGRGLSQLPEAPRPRGCAQVCLSGRCRCGSGRCVHGDKDRSSILWARKLCVDILSYVQSPLQDGALLDGNFGRWT